MNRCDDRAAVFLMMDCDANPRPDLGFRFLSCYLERSLDDVGMVGLSLYLFYRAMLRGKLACLQAAESSAEQAAPLWLQAYHYYALAGRYQQPSVAKLFVVAGYSGSGKSRVAWLGCGLERAVVIRSDALRKTLR